jgi:hypothetical protein
MKHRSLLLSALVFAGLSIASAKSYQITLSETSKAGNVQLAPGSYSVKLEGTNAIFTDENGKKISAPVKVENAEKKHDATAVQTTKTNDGDKIQAIELGGSTETLEFGE